MIENIFYNYVYLDPRKPGDYNYGDLHFDFEPFYVGKGCYNRLYDHLNETIETAYNLKKFNKIQKILNEGLEIIILKFFENSDEKTSLEKEIYLIATIGRHDKKLGPLTNLTDGGEGISGYKYTDDQIIKNRLQPSCKKVYQYDLDGNFIKEYNSISEAGRINNYDVCSLWLCCVKRMKSAYKFMWSFEKINGLKYLKYDNSHSCKKVYQYDFDFNLLNEYPSVVSASKYTGIKHISSCCLKNIMSAGGFYWSYYILTNSEIVDIKIKLDITMKNKRGICKPILQYDLNDIYLNEYPSIIKASNLTNTNYGGIISTCKDVQKTAGGFKWRYKEL